MIRRTFLDHPRTVGEGYWQHFRIAGGFGLTMIAGGLKALVHAVLPNCFETAGGDTIRALHNTMIEKRGAKRDATFKMLSEDWMI